MRLLLLSALMFLCFAVSAQFAVSGTVTDSTTNKGVELVTISLKNVATQKSAGGTFSNADGTFLFEKIAAGDYEMTISFVGYVPKTMPVKVDADIKLGTIILSPDQKTLGEAVVNGQKSLIVRTGEKTIYNASQNPMNQSGTSEDVLRNVPGVSVDQDGNITIKGKSDVKILVDGRPNAMAETNLSAFLKSLPASSIESIELITNPSARYDAEGNAGIINIKLKKGKADGLNGNVMAGYGYPNRYNGDFNINYRKKQFNIFGGYSVFYQKVGNQWIETRKITIDDTTTYYNMNSLGTSKNLFNNLKAGFDYFGKKDNNLTYTFNGNYSTSAWFTDARSENLDATRKPTNIYRSTNDEHGKNLSISNDIAYQKKLDTAGRELSVNLTYTYLNNKSGAPLVSQAFDSLGVLDEIGSLYRRIKSGNKIHNAIVQLDYAHPLPKGHKIETGFKNETTKNKNIFDAYRTLNGVENRDTLLSNSFNYTENIGAIYLIYSGSHKEKLSWSLGARAEHTRVKSDNALVNRQYLSFFPSASLDVNFTEMQSMGISYSRRIERPAFRQINNSVTYIDQYSTWQGNPYLQPNFSHIINLNYSNMFKQHMISLEATGSLDSGGFTESSRIDSGRITRGGIINGSSAKVFNFSFYSKFQITKWWDIQMNHNYSYSHYSFKPGVNTRSFAGHQYNLWSSITFKFWKNTQLNINGWFNTGGVGPQGTSKPVGMLNASIKKSFFKDRFTVSIAAQNILNTMKWRWTVSNSGLNTEGSWQSFNRNVGINLSYRFGSGKPVQRKEKEGNSRLGEGKSK